MATAGVANLNLHKRVAHELGDWADHSACRKDLNVLWVAPPTAATRPHQIELADEICGRCPVWRQCNAWALSEPEFEGIAAGLLWPWGGICQNTGHGIKGDKDRWCAACEHSKRRN